MIVETALRESVIALAQAAGTAILDIYRATEDGVGMDVTRKADNSPLTAADLASHRIIVEGLKALTPDIPVLSEEAAEIETAERRRWSRLWLVDPLDGTREFVKRNGEFTVNIALIDMAAGGMAVFGVIQAPVGGRLWWGSAGGGAFVREQDGAERRIQTRASASTPLRVAASRSHRDARTEAFIAKMSADVGAPDLVGIGSSLKFCNIAEGQIDCYPRFGPTSEWDTAAGQCIVEAAGGIVCDPSARPLRYNRRDTLLNGDFIVVGDPALAWPHWLETEA